MSWHSSATHLGEGESADARYDIWGREGRVLKGSIIIFEKVMYL